MAPEPEPEPERSVEPADPLPPPDPAQTVQEGATGPAGGPHPPEAAPAAKPVRAPPEAINGSGGHSPTSEGAEAPPGPSEPVYGPSAAAAAAAAASLHAAQLLQQRLRLADLAERLRDARPKRTHDVRALDWAAMEDAAQAMAELPTPAWRTWRDSAGTEGATMPPRPMADLPAGEVRR